MQQDEPQVLELGQQLGEDGPYVVGLKTNAKGKQEALLLFLDNAEDIKDKGLRTHNEAIKAFSQSEGHRGHKRSAYQIEKDIDANQTDGGIRQFTAAEWKVIMNNLMGVGLDDQDPKKAQMLALWDLVKQAVEVQGERYGWVNTASSSYRYMFQNVQDGDQFSSSPARHYTNVAVMSGVSLTAEQVAEKYPAYKIAA